MTAATPCCKSTQKILLRLLHLSISLYVVLLLLWDPRSVLNNDLDGTFNAAAYLFMVYSIGCICFYLLICFMDPGTVYLNLDSESNKNAVYRRLTTEDNVAFLPPRHFCLTCKRFDHHCIWLDTCIAQRNHTLYTIFLVMEELNVIMALIIAIASMSRLAEEEAVDEWSRHVWPYWIALVILVPAVVVVGWLAVYHFYLATQNTTTWENSARGRITYLRDLDEDFDPFSSGWLTNLNQFCCTLMCREPEWEVIYVESLKRESLKNSLNLQI